MDPDNAEKPTTSHERDEYVCKLLDIDMKRFFMKTKQAHTN